MNERRLKEALHRLSLPDESTAQSRTWPVVERAFLEREPIPWPRRHLRPLIALAAILAVAAAAASPPGLAVLGSLRDAIGRERAVGVRPAHRELVRLPTAGRLLVDSRRGPWVVQEQGDRRLLGPYRMASWSPHGLFVAAVSDYELYALEPNGTVRWSKPRKQRLAFPRWSFEGYRIAYLSDETLRVITGDGARDWGLGAANPKVAPAWRPRTHEVAWVGADGAVRVADADARRVLWHEARTQVQALQWSDDGRQLLVLQRTQLTVLLAGGRRWTEIAIPRGFVLGAAAFRPRTHQIAYIVRSALRSRIFLFAGGSRPLFAGGGTLDALAWSPDAEWLLAAWPDADEWIFVHVSLPPKLVAVTAIARQFDPAAKIPTFPQLDGWCCSTER